LDGGGMNLSAKAQKLLASQRIMANFPYLVKITHNNMDYYYANSSNNITYKGDIYNASSFSIDPPDQDGAKIGNATLTMSVVDQVWIERMRSTQIPAKLQFIAVIVSDESGASGIEALEENSFTLRAANWNELAVSWEMSFDERMANIITSVKCTPQITPGCA
jgi:hypothetical protein